MKISSVALTPNHRQVDFGGKNKDRYHVKKEITAQGTGNLSLATLLLLANIGLASMTGCSNRNTITGPDNSSKTELVTDTAQGITNHTRTDAEIVAQTLRTWATETLGLQVPNRAIRMIKFDDDATGYQITWRPDPTRTDNDHLAFIEQVTIAQGVPQSYTSKVFSLLPNGKLMCEEKQTYDNPYTNSNPYWIDLEPKEYENTGDRINYRFYNSTGLLNAFLDDTTSNDVLQLIGYPNIKLRNFVFKTNGPETPETIITDAPMHY